MTTVQKILVVLTICWCFLGAVFGQETVVVGQVFDKATHTALPLVSVYFEGADFYTQTDKEGYFLIKNRGKEDKLVFSLIGYHKKYQKIKPGSNVGVNIELEEKQNILEQILVLPTGNPANELMKKVRQRRTKNNIILPYHIDEENVVFLTQQKNRGKNNKLFVALSQGHVTSKDSALLIPLYMRKNLYQQEHKTKKLVQENRFETSTGAVQLVEHLLKGMDEDINFYHNAIPIMGKNIISPLATVGNTFYRYYLTDSTVTKAGKTYTVNFRTRNPKNLAFDGTLWIDSTTLALRKIEVRLPSTANINYLHRLRITHTYQPSKGYFIPQKKQKTWYLTYHLLKDSLNQSPELLVNSQSNFILPNDKWVEKIDSFAGTDYSQKELEEKMHKLQTTPLYKVANYIADAVFTGYLNAGYVDIGKMVNIMRLTDIEGFRVGLPIKTNEQLWKNFSIGGYGAYGFRDKKWKYGAEMQWRLPINRGKTTLGAFYADDYRRPDYDYNDYIWQNNPLETGDENIVSTLLSFTSKKYLNKRKEFSLVLKNKWHQDLQSTITYRDITYFANEYMPMVQSLNGLEFNQFRQQNVSLTTRWSWDERAITDHFQEIYLPSPHPIVYATADVGSYRLSGRENGQYVRLTGSVYQQRQFLLGDWRYMMEMGAIFGAVPYPLLHRFHGQQGGAFSLYEFAMMNHNEFVADRYVTAMGEVRLNGLLFNNLPIVRNLNLRELFGVKFAYGGLHSKHTTMLDLPTFSTSLVRPYAEVIVGVTNLLRVISIQSIWRLTDRKKQGVIPWGIRFSVVIDF